MLNLVNMLDTITDAGDLCNELSPVLRHLLNAHSILHFMKVFNAPSRKEDGSLVLVIKPWGLALICRVTLRER